MRRYLLILLLSAGPALTGCALSDLPFAYQPDVQQGNIITEEMIEQLRPGMTKRQVQYVLGSPAIRDIFRENRWDYVHAQAAGGGGEPTRLTVIFDDSERLETLKGDLAPADWGA